MVHRVPPVNKMYQFCLPDVLLMYVYLVVLVLGMYEKIGSFRLIVFREFSVFENEKKIVLKSDVFKLINPTILYAP